MLAPQERHELILGAIRVLILVHEQKLEALAIRRETLRVLLEDAHRQHQQIVEIHGVGLAQRALELRIHRGRRAAQRVQRQRRVFLGRHERVLGVGDGAAQRLRAPLLGRDAEPIHHAPDDGERLLFIVDRERGRPPDEHGLAPQNPGADRVKGAAPHPRRRFAEQARDARAHLLGGLVGERHGEDARRVHAVVLDEMGDAPREDAGLAGAGTRQHEQRTLEMEHRLALGRIQVGERVGGAGLGHQGSHVRRRHPGSITSKVAPRSLGTSVSRPR